MSRKYTPKKATGREYVDYATKFTSLTILNCQKLPEKWDDYLLSPLVNTAKEIEDIVVAANRIYINEGNMAPDALVAAYSERIQELQKALRLFSVFDVSFDRLCSYVDISFSEKTRLKNLLIGIIHDAQQEDDKLKQLEIKVVSRGSDMEYISVGGKRCLRLMLTSKGKDLWLKAEREAEQYIRNRLDADKKAVNRLQKA